MDQRAQTLLKRLTQDQQSGASALTLQTLDDLKDYLEDVEPSNTRDLVRLSERIKTARPSMVPLANAMKRWQQAMEDQPPPQALAQVRTAFTSATSEMVERALELVSPGATLLIHSNSSAVMKLLQKLQQNRVPFVPIVTQSAPGNEGYTVAKELNRLGIGVTLITDAQLGIFMPQVDLNISGCDTWLGSHFVNKSGTYLQALAARDQNKPFWVLADSFKNCDQNPDQFSLEEMSADELSAPKGEFITPRNIYFELIPTGLATGRVDELGCHRLEEAAANIETEDLDSGVEPTSDTYSDIKARF